MELPAGKFRLTTEQLISVFNQLGLSQARFSPTALVVLQLTPQQSNTLSTPARTYGYPALPSGLVPLDANQVNSIFSQLGLQSQFTPSKQIYLQLTGPQFAQARLPEVFTLPTVSIPQSGGITLPSVSSYNLPSVRLPSVSLPYASQSYGLQLPTASPARYSRINREFVRRLAQSLDISEQELAGLIQDESADVPELTRRLNEILPDLYPPLNYQEVQQLIYFTSY